MGIARFLLVAGVTPPGSASPGWPGRSGLQGSSRADGTWSAWRLLGGNNRELGRSAQAFPDPSGTLEAIALLRSRFADLVATHQTDERGLWRWRLTIDDDPVVVSSRAYLRQRESHYSLAQFMAVAPGAEGPRTRPAPSLPPAQAGAVGPDGEVDPQPPVPPTARLQRSRRIPVPVPAGRAVVVPRPTSPGFPHGDASGAAWAR